MDAIVALVLGGGVIIAITSIGIVGILGVLGLARHMMDHAFLFLKEIDEAENQSPPTDLQ